jgi:zinc protease
MCRIAHNVVTLAALAFGLAATAAEEPGPAGSSLRLANGLDVEIRPLPGAKQVAVLTLYRVGGDHDPEGRSGLAHLVEHLYTTCAAGATPARTAEAFAALYLNAWNAQTGDLYTVYATVVAPDRLEAELADAAARMGDLRIEQADLDREKPRLTAEVANMFGGIPALAAQNFAREMLRPTPRGGRRGGLPEHVAKITLDEVRDRWGRLYKPANARLVLAGAVDPATARPLVGRIFAKVPSGQAVESPGEPVAVRAGSDRPARLTTLHVPAAAPGAAPAACVAYPAPPLTDTDLPAFLVLATRLQMVSARPANPGGKFRIQYAPIDDGVALAFCAPLEASDPSDALGARIDEFLAARADRVPSQFDRMQTRAMYGFLLGFAAPAVAAANPYGAAFSSARLAQEGFDPTACAKAIDAVTAEDLKRVAAKWLAPERRVSVVVR